MSQAEMAGKAPTKLNGSEMAERNLERALLDFELANARVLDLTQRLVGLTNELVSTREQLEQARLHVNHLQAAYDACMVENGQIKASLAYRGLRVLGDVRARMRR